MVASSERFIQTLRQANLRITLQRRAVCEYLAHTDLHPTPYQVYDAVSQRWPDISRATVYNTLNVLRDLGAIMEINVGTDHTHYDTDVTPHVNLICLRCDSVFDYHGETGLEELKTQITQETGFVSVAGQIELLGFCAECRTRRVEEIRAQAQK